MSVNYSLSTSVACLSFLWHNVLSEIISMIKASNLSEKKSSPKTKHDEVAVNIAEEVIRSAWSKWNFPLVAVPTPIENKETINAATVAWTWTSAILPTTMWHISFALVIFPKFACVDSLESRVMSRFPFNPSNAGTSIKSCGMCRKTSQCCMNKQFKD